MPDSLKVYLPYGPPVLTRAGWLRGLRTSIPYLPGSVIFGMTAGALASKAGVGLWEAVL